MFAKTLLASAALAVVASAQTDEQKFKYQNFAGAMGVWYYDWAPYEITTEDGYTITLMNVTKKHSDSKVKAKKNPVLVQPIPGVGADTYLQIFMGMIYPADIPPTLKLLDAGHDLWMLYPRGSEYSSHATYSNEDPKFWDFTYNELGEIDMKAALDFVYTKTQKKTSLFGMQLANNSIMAGLANDYDFFKERTDKVLMQAPCRIMSEISMAWMNEKSFAGIKATGIFELGGPTWYLTAGKISKALGLGIMRELALAGYPSVVKGLSLKLMDQMGQNTKVNRFQAYSPDFWSKQGGIQTDLIDLSVIKDIPVGMFMATNDEVCTTAQNEETKQMIGDMVQAYKFYDDPKNNSDFFSYNKQDFIDDMVNFLDQAPATFLQ